MGKPSLILAALAADALPSLRFVSVQDISNPNEDMVTELLTTDDSSQVVLKSPKSALALTQLGLEVRALRVLKNVNLPFNIPSLLGETSPSAIYKALAFDYLAGRTIDLSRIKVDDPILGSVGQTLARIHSIPSQFVIDAGLPEFDSALRVRERVAEFDRAMETGKIHPDLLERWQTALLDVNLFRYQPTVVHGNLSGDAIVTEGPEIVGINDWSSLSVDDPALDLAALFAETTAETASAIAQAYEGSIRADRNLKQRANLYMELASANYLLNALDSSDPAQIEEAEDILSGLHQDLLQGLLPSLSPTDLAGSSSEVVTPISQAASFTGPITIVTEQIDIIEEPEQRQD